MIGWSQSTRIVPAHAEARSSGVLAVSSGVHMEVDEGVALGFRLTVGGAGSRHRALLIRSDPAC